MTREELEKELSAVNAQLQALPTEQTTQVAVPTTGPSTWWTPQSAMTMSAVVLVFALIVLLLATYLILKKPSSDAEMILRVFGTIVIIFGALFLVVAGYTETQMGPVMGLLGTIVGYLLGKTPSKDKQESAKQTP